MASIKAKNQKRLYPDFPSKREINTFGVPWDHEADRLRPTATNSQTNKHISHLSASRAVKISSQYHATDLEANTRRFRLGLCDSLSTKFYTDATTHLDLISDCRSQITPCTDPLDVYRSKVECSSQLDSRDVNPVGLQHQARQEEAKDRRLYQPCVTVRYQPKLQHSIIQWFRRQISATRI